jgi:hypothetical protein
VELVSMRTRAQRNRLFLCLKNVSAYIARASKNDFISTRYPFNHFNHTSMKLFLLSLVIGFSLLAGFSPEKSVGFDPVAVQIAHSFEEVGSDVSLPVFPLFAISGEFSEAQPVPAAQFIGLVTLANSVKSKPVRLLVTHERDPPFRICKV